MAVEDATPWDAVEWVAEQKADQWRSVVEESMWRDPYISPDRAQTEQSAQMEKTMLMISVITQFFTILFTEKKIVEKNNNDEKTSKLK